MSVSHSYTSILNIGVYTKVDGGWGSWGAWDQCSVSCGVGIQHRERQCNNPLPSLFGQHCFGHDLDDRICSNPPCSGAHLQLNINKICFPSC